MNACYNLQLNDFKLSKLESGQELFENYEKVIINSLHKLISNESSIDGTTIKNKWFPLIDADVFISHSHNDLEKAIDLGGWLKKEFGLKAFVDSCVWGSIKDLFKPLFKSPSTNNDYEFINHITSNIHMMLSIAIMEVMDRAKCTFFINTPNSISKKDLINETSSPWIYYELELARYLRQRDNTINKARIMFEDSVQQKFNYEINIEHLINIGKEELINWKNQYNGNADSLKLLNKIATNSNY